MKPIYKIENLSFSYNKIKQIFHQVHLELDLKKITLLEGANGSGKTTFCRLLAGLENIFSGSILLDGMNISKLSINKISENIVYIKQEPQANIVASTADEDMYIWQSKFLHNETETSVQLRKKALSKFKMESVKDAPVWNMSGGEIKRIALSALILNYNKYWILDEPTAGLDKKSVDILIDMIRTRKNDGYGTLIVTHRIKEIEHLIDIKMQIENWKINRIR